MELIFILALKNKYRRAAAIRVLGSFFTFTWNIDKLKLYDELKKYTFYFMGSQETPIQKLGCRPPFGIKILINIFAENIQSIWYFF
jgi:hypothetical protein